VRKTGADAGLDEVAASVAAHGDHLGGTNVTNPASNQTKTRFFSPNGPHATHVKGYCIKGHTPPARCFRIGRGSGAQHTQPFGHREVFPSVIAKCSVTGPSDRAGK
jgi:hypothetical protein